ncbi:hypothetical protein EXIGLDRAFT_346511 [Exidia glandulosa HHB12029]|uniref:Uncharacterized protein n=1 Tax=Exidia glandulosa HHB12029 TaxID=1314781 RepID=A0A165CFU5_EXIGL|nr:hypothetical protein EXIGLDRAFT_346511 [Exidia glandulosa HHB12029]
MLTVVLYSVDIGQIILTTRCKDSNVNVMQEDGIRKDYPKPNDKTVVISTEFGLQRAREPVTRSARCPADTQPTSRETNTRTRASEERRKYSRCVQSRRRGNTTAQVR